MEPTPLNEFMERETFLEHIHGLQNIVSDLKGNFSGTRLSYLDRLSDVLVEVEGAMQHADLNRTPLKIFSELRSYFENLSAKLHDRDNENFWNDIRNTTDNILVSLQFIRKKDLVVDAENSVKRILETFKKNVRLSEDQLTDLIESLKANTIKVNTQLIQDSEDEFNKLKQTVSKVDKLAQFVSGKALSNEFTEQARRHRIGKWIWTGLTLGLAALTMGWLFAFLYRQYETELLSSTDRLSFSLLTTKILITITLGLITRWASKRASHHLADEARYRRLALNMDTLDSFVGNLDTENKNRVIAFVAAKTLSDYPSDMFDAEFDSFSAGDLLKSIGNKPTEMLPKVH